MLSERDLTVEPFRSGRDYDFVQVYAIRDQVEIHFQKRDADGVPHKTGGVGLTIAAAGSLAGTLFEATFVAEEWLARKNAELGFLEGSLDAPFEDEDDGADG